MFNNVYHSSQMHMPLDDARTIDSSTHSRLRGVHRVLTLLFLKLVDASIWHGRLLAQRCQKAS